MPTVPGRSPRCGRSYVPNRLPSMGDRARCAATNVSRRLLGVRHHRRVRQPRAEAHVEQRHQERSDRRGVISPVRALAGCRRRKWSSPSPARSPSPLSTGRSRAPVRCNCRTGRVAARAGPARRRAAGRSAAEPQASGEMAKAGALAAQALRLVAVRLRVTLITGKSLRGAAPRKMTDHARVILGVEAGEWVRRRTARAAPRNARVRRLR